MPPSVHKVLIHGPAIVRDSVLPIGQFSKKVLESSHKLLRSYRRDHRKISREKTNEDIFLRLHLHSNPYITLSGILPKVQKKKVPVEVTDMLQDQVNTRDIDSEDASSLDDED